MDSTGPDGRVTSTAEQDAGRAALAALHEAERRRHLSPRERAQIRDRVARIRCGLEPKKPPAGRTAAARAVAPRYRAVHGDVDINGDLVDELRQRIPTTREERLARCITADSPELAAAQLRNVLHALDGVRA